MGAKLRQQRARMCQGRHPRWTSWQAVEAHVSLPTLSPPRAAATSPSEELFISSKTPPGAHPALCSVGDGGQAGSRLLPREVRGGASQLCGRPGRGRATRAPWSPSGQESGAASCLPSGCARNRTGGKEARLRGIQPAHSRPRARTPQYQGAPISLAGATASPTWPWPLSARKGGFPSPVMLRGTAWNRLGAPGTSGLG